MKKIYYLLTLLLIPALLISFSGGSPGGKSGSPGDGGSSCTDCHAGTPQQQEGWITSNIPATGFVPGETYAITVTGFQENPQKMGFELTSENTANNSKTGTFVIQDAGRTKLINSSSAVTHTSAGTLPTGGDNISWTADWTAPEAGSAPESVTFYAAVNVSNNNGGNSGDQINLTQLSIPQSTLGITELAAAGIHMYPNPSSDYLYFDAHANWELKIYNLSGALVLEETIAAGSHRFDVQNLDRGLYMAVISNGKNTLSEKILIQ